MAGIRFQFNDGGRAAAGYRGKTDDCVCRAISIAAELPYQQVYDAINGAAQSERLTRRCGKRSSARGGVHKPTTRRFMKILGWRWVPTMQIGSGCKVHLRESELPPGRLVVMLSRHACAVIDGVVHDTFLDDRDGTRCVYGYYVKAGA